MANAKWIIDPLHSEVQFKIKHLVISNVTGSFSKFEGSAVSATDGDDFEDAHIAFSLEVNSIYTGQPQRDQHLRASDFFDAEKYPVISFRSVSFKKDGVDEYKLTGDLTIKDVTKTVTLDVEFGGATKDPFGNYKAGFEVNGKINRKEFGLVYDAVTESGGLLLGEEVKINANVQLVKQAAEVPAETAAH